MHYFTKYGSGEEYFPGLSSDDETSDKEEEEEDEAIVTASRNTDSKEENCQIQIASHSTADLSSNVPLVSASSFNIMSMTFRQLMTIGSLHDIGGSVYWE